MHGRPVCFLNTNYLRVSRLKVSSAFISNTIYSNYLCYNNKYIASLAQTKWQILCSSKLNVFCSVGCDEIHVIMTNLSSHLTMSIEIFLPIIYENKLCISTYYSSKFTRTPTRFYTFFNIMSLHIVLAEVKHAVKYYCQNTWVSVPLQQVTICPACVGKLFHLL